MSAALGALFSSNWYRIANLRPRLRGHVHIHRHSYRGQIWFVIEDRVAGKYHRFNPAFHRIISWMDGSRTMDDIWQLLASELADDSPSQDDVLNLLTKLHSNDLVQCDVSPDVADLFERGSKQKRRKNMGRFLNPFAMYFPLWDPDAFLDRTVHLFKPIAGWLGVILWLCLVMPALLMVPTHWEDLTENLSDRLLSLNNLLVMALAYPLIKVIHELGHAYITKLKGGEVHELGIMLLVFFPTPYVDASSSSAFVKKSHRMLVGAGGMLVELVVAALAFYAWLLLEPGLARSIAYNIVILASVTTLFFNGNPLLRYDGYYILADWLEIPNLAARSNKYWQYLADRYLFGVKNNELIATTKGERHWFLAYAPLSFAYRMLVLIGITLFVAQQYFVLGVILACWGAVMSLGLPAYKGLSAMFSQPRYVHKGKRVRAVAGGMLLTVLVMLFAVPMPYHTYAEGVVWMPEQAILRAQENGFVKKLFVQPGQYLKRGETVLASDERTLIAELAAQAARVAEARARYDAAWGVNTAQAAQFEDELHRQQAALARIQERVSQLTLHTDAEGRLLVEPNELMGRFLKKGDVVGYVLGEYVPMVRLVVPQADVDQVRLNTQGVEVKLPQHADKSWPAKLTRIIPGAAKELPSPALGQAGGGGIVMDPRDKEGKKTLQSLFEVELQLLDESPSQYLGSHVYVHFAHAAEPIGLRWGRALRRLFLSQFNV